MQQGFCSTSRAPQQGTPAHRGRLRGPTRLWHRSRRTLQVAAAQHHREWQNTTSALRLQEWRAFRAHLVELERQQSAWAPEDTSANKSALVSTPSGAGCWSAPSTSADTSTPQVPLVIRRPMLPVSRRQQGSKQSHTYTRAGSAMWAHELPGPEVGSVLLAQSGLSELGALYHKAVVLLLSHDDMRGSVGLILNKPSSLTLSDAPSLTTDLTEYQDVLGAQRLMLGGPVSLDTLSVLHRYRGLPGSVFVAEGLYLGGLNSAVELIQAGLACPSDFLLCVGLTRWSPSQLNREVRTGMWRCVATAPDLLQPAPQNRRLRTHLSDLAPPATDTDTHGCMSGALYVDSGRVRRRPAIGGAASSAHRSGSVGPLAHHPAYRGVVPPLLPPPVHPATPLDACMWRRIMSLAQYT